MNTGLCPLVDKSCDGSFDFDLKKTKTGNENTLKNENKMINFNEMLK